MKTQEWKNRPSRFIAITDCGVEVFGKLFPFFEEAHEVYLSKYYLVGNLRKAYRQYVMYKNSPLSCMEEGLEFILSYLKLNLLQEKQADLFGLNKNNVMFCDIFRLYK